MNAQMCVISDVRGLPSLAMVRKMSPNDPIHQDMAQGLADIFASYAARTFHSCCEYAAAVDVDVMLLASIRRRQQHVCIVSHYC